MIEEEIIITVEPLFDKNKEKICICCPEAHIFSYDFKPSSDLYSIITRKTRESGDRYKKRKFKVTIVEMIDDVLQNQEKGK